MSSSRLQRFRKQLKSSLWIAPILAIPLAMAASRLLHWLDARLAHDLLGISLSGATAMYQAMVTATVTFIVFTFGLFLVTIQIAGAQMTPRIIASTLLRADVPKYTVALFMFTLLISMSALNNMDKTVNQLVALAVAVLALACFVAFMYLIDYSSRTLRPVSVLKHVGDIGQSVIERVYPDPSYGPDVQIERTRVPDRPDLVVRHHGSSAIILSVDIAAIVAEAERTDSLIEFVPQVGDFVGTEDPLFDIHGGAGQIDAQGLTAAITFGDERTMEQDPTFAFRVIVDIALKALSPAINDPTTAVLAIDQLQGMLRQTGKRHLRTDAIADRNGQVRLIFRTPNWEDFVHLTFSEIRACGSNNLQIVRRLRAMIQDLLRTLPPHRHPALIEAMSLLDREVARHFTYPEELALASIADTQGLGGHSAAETVTRIDTPGD